MPNAHTNTNKGATASRHREERLQRDYSVSSFPRLAPSSSKPKCKPLTEVPINNSTTKRSRVTRANWKEEDILKIIQWLGKNKQKFDKKKVSVYKEIAFIFENKYTVKQIADKITYLRNRHKLAADSLKKTGWGARTSSTVKG